MIDVGPISEVGPRRAAATFLGRLDLDLRAELLGLGRRRRYPARSIVFIEGDDAHAVHVLCSGVVKVSVTVGVREVVLDILGQGDLLGELAVVDGRARSATATTLRPTEAVAIPSADFTAFLSDHPGVAFELLRDVAGRLREASRRQVEYGALDAVGRVCRRLVELIDRYGGPPSGHVVIDGPLTQSDIAAWAGLSREAVVKALHAMRALGWIRTTSRAITVVDQRAVRSRASVSPG